jgi:hypothetical protein
LAHSTVAVAFGLMFSASSSMALMASSHSLEATSAPEAAPRRAARASLDHIEHSVIVCLNGQR